MSNIEILEEFIDKQKSNKGTFVPTDFEITALENLIQENKELKEKNKNLEKFFLKYYDDIENELQGLLNHKFIDFIPKSKVKEKIEETNNEKLNYNEDDYWFEQEVKGYAIDKLQELLEGGE